MLGVLIEDRENEDYSSPPNLQLTSVGSTEQGAGYLQPRLIGRL